MSRSNEIFTVLVDNVTSRTNGAITRGFEQDVGSRTTHYTFSTNTLMNSMRSYADSGFRGPPVSKVGVKTRRRVARVLSQRVTFCCRPTGDALRFPA